MTADRVEDHLPLKPLTYSILLALREGDSYGYGIAKRVGEPAGGGIRLAPSNLYHVLDRLAGMGFIESSHRRDPNDERRTYYRLTGLGRAVFQAETERLKAVLGLAGDLSSVRESR